MNQVLQKSVIGAFITLMAGGCVTAPPEPVSLEERLSNRGFVIGQPIEKVRISRITGWSYEGRGAVIIYGPGSQKYLFRVRPTCENILQHVQRITVSDTAGRVTDKDSLEIWGAGGSALRCQIDTIHELKKLQ
jgi:hypothetical protein